MKLFVLCTRFDFLYLFIYFFHWCFTLSSRIFHLYDSYKFYSGRKQDSGGRKPATIRRLFYSLIDGEGQHELDSRRPHWWATPGSLRRVSSLSDWATKSLLDWMFFQRSWKLLTASFRTIPSYFYSTCSFWVLGGLRYTSCLGGGPWDYWPESSVLIDGKHTNVSFEACIHINPAASWIDIMVVLGRNVARQPLLYTTERHQVKNMRRKQHLQAMMKTYFACHCIIGQCRPIFSDKITVMLLESSF